MGRGAWLGGKTAIDVHYQPSIAMFWEKMCNATNCLIYVEPEPLGLIDRNASSFHPQKLQLQFIKSDNNTYVNMYEIWIEEYSSSSWTFTSFPFSLSRNLEPGQNYTVRIRAIAWYYYSYQKKSVPMIDQIQTMRK